MATSGTFIFSPDLAELVDEALERCRIDPAKITSRHILSARRSMRFMCSDWATKDYHDFRIVNNNFTLVQGQASYSGGVDVDVTDNNLIDILDVSLTRSSVDTPVEFTSRDAYDDIPDKTTEGRPDRVFVDKQRDQIVLTFWPVPENSTDVITYDAVRKFEDFDTAADNADIPYYMYDAFAYGLAFRLAEKFGVPDMESALYQKAQMAFRDATNASRERRDVRLMPSSSKRRRYR
jgi:hypothetical protein